MAGSDSRFNAAQFRDAIRFAMTMGMPENIQEQATFQWDRDASYTLPDADGKPFNWAAVPASEVTFADVTVPVAVEFLSKGGDTQDTRVGQMDVSRVTITVMDEYFDDLTQNGVFANKVRLADADYIIQFVGPPIGLFEVTVYQIHAQAVDEV